MATIIDKISKHIPPNERYQVFDFSQLSSGDLIDVLASLSSAARSVLINVGTASALTVRFNTQVTIVPNANDRTHPLRKDIANARKFTDDSANPLVLTATTTFQFKDEIPVKDIEITAISGTGFILVV